MSLSNTFSTLSRIFRNIEVFGIDGYRLWRGKLSKDDGVVAYRLKGLKEKLYLRNNTSDYTTFRQVFIDKEYDYPTNFTPDVIIDCGANIGLASIYYANKYPGAKIISVEPESSNFELLKKNTEGYPNITCLKNGIWDKTATLEIIDTGQGKWAFVTKEVNYENENTISAISINDLFTQFSIKSADIVKIDIEGSEKVVFSNNYQEWLQKTKLVIVELHDKTEHGTSHSFFKAMSNFDYIMDIKGENIYCLL